MPGLASLSKSLFSRFGERSAAVTLLELDETDKPLGDYIAFQYFPDTITDTKAVNYQNRDIPGGSLPLYQWISSGERLLGFTALFTTDTDLLTNTNSYIKLKENGQLRRNVDVRTALLWLRRYMLPQYKGNSGVGTPITQAPRKAILRIANSGFGLQGGAYGYVDQGHLLGQNTAGIGAQTNVNFGSTVGIVVPDAVPVIMTQCDITYEAFFPSGLPRVASVQLQFAQIAQLEGAVNFPRTGLGLDAVVKKGVTFNERSGLNGQQSFMPYNIIAKFG